MYDLELTSNVSVNSFENEYGIRIIFMSESVKSKSQQQKLTAHTPRNFLLKEIIRY